MDGTIDNQQITLGHKIAWLAGIWDGEGTFSIVRQYKKSGRKQLQPFYLSPKLTMENTSIDIIDECCLIMDKLGIAYYISDRKASSSKHKRRFVIQVCRFSEIVKFCDAVAPYIVSKIEQLKILRMFSFSREQKRSNGHHCPYSEEEYNYAEKLRELNKLGPSDISTTIRKTLARQIHQQSRWMTKRKEKIESDLYGDVEKRAEMTLSH